MIDLEREAPVTFAAAPQLIPAINAAPGMEARKPLHERTIRNWATKGKRGVVLETVAIGGILVTTRQAIKRFFDRLTVAREQRFIDQGHDQDNQRRRIVRTGRRNDKHQAATRQRLTDRHGI